MTMTTTAWVAKRAALLEEIYAELGGTWSFGLCQDPDIYKQAQQLRNERMAQ
jgi:hypothetical protein